MEYEIEEVKKSDLFLITRTWGGEEIAYNKKTKQAYLLTDGDWDGEKYTDLQRVQYTNTDINGYRFNSKAKNKIFYGLYPVYASSNLESGVVGYADVHDGNVKILILKK